MQNLLVDFAVLGLDKVKLFMERLFYSDVNVNGLIKEHLQVIVAIQTTASFARKAIDVVYDNFRSFENIDKFTEDETNFQRKLLAMRKEILSGKRVPNHERFYRQYFQIKKTLIRGIKVTIIEKTVKATKRYYGYFALYSKKRWMVRPH